MTETGIFTGGIVNDKDELCCDFVLSERNFGHTLALGNDRTINKDFLSDGAYYDAAIISKRLTVAGVDKLTPEMILALDGDDGDLLAEKIMALDKRREEFRKTRGATKAKATSPPEAGSTVG